MIIGSIASPPFSRVIAHGLLCGGPECRGWPRPRAIGAYQRAHESSLVGDTGRPERGSSDLNYAAVPTLATGGRQPDDCPRSRLGTDYHRPDAGHSQREDRPPACAAPQGTPHRERHEVGPHGSTPDQSHPWPRITIMLPDRSRAVNRERPPRRPGGRRPPPAGPPLQTPRSPRPRDRPPRPVPPTGSAP